MSKRAPKANLPTSCPPPIAEHHVKLPLELSQILNANLAHQRGVTGKGVRIAVIDSGFYPHPFYESRGYKISRIPTRKEPQPHIDEYGHGTAQLASLVSLAPDSEILAIKCMDRDPCYSLRKAIALKPDILVCAWGFNIDRPGTKKLPEEYQNIHRMLVGARKKGICVIAAAGNGQYAFPGNMPEVISAGGVYYSDQGTFSASDVASQFVSSVFPGRQVPDICGLVGNLPHGRLLLVPVPPRARLAKRPAFSMIAAGESMQTQVSGWALFSGTSAAAAMIAGAAALLLQVKPDLTPQEIKQVLMETAQSVANMTSGVVNVEAALRKIEFSL